MSRSVPRTYAELLRRVKVTLFAGQRAADLAWVKTFHETGRLIHCHVLLNKDRADYGAQVMHQLARDTGTNERRLYECRQFYRAYPILRLTAELGWTRGLLLSQVADEGRRQELTAQTLKNNWPTDEIKAHVRALNAASRAVDDAIDISPVGLLTARRGTPGLHPVVDRGSGPEVDLGFKLYRELGPSTKLTIADIVRLNEDGVRKIPSATKAELFTYTATVRRVVDGDTLVVALAIAPGIAHELKLRLRGLDCPEMSTAAGRAAKLFVDGLVRTGDKIVLSTSKPDKYDRYLADVFVDPSGAGRVIRDEAPTGANSQSDRAPIFLNNALLEAGHAVRYDGVGPKDPL